MSEIELTRLQNWRLGIVLHAEEISGNVAKTCRYYGISRACFYRCTIVMRS